MIPDAKTKFSEFLKLLNDMVPPYEVNIFQLNRVRNEALKMKKDEPAEAFALLGIVSCLENDVKAMHSYHQNALQYENSPRQKMFYGTSLINLHLFKEGYKYIMKRTKKRIKSI